MALDRNSYLEELNTIKTQIISGCPKCGGQGYSTGDALEPETLTANVVPCECSELWHFRLWQIKANLPREFWDVENASIKHNRDCFHAVQSYVENIDNALKYGLGFLMMGENGVGKTTASAMIICGAIRKKHSAFYITSHDLADVLYLSVKDENVLPILDERLASDFMVLDELDKVHIKTDSTFIQSKLDSILRHRAASMKPTTIITNMTEVELFNSFGSSVASILTGKLKQLRFVPGDYRKEQGKRWDELLKGQK